MATEMMTYEDYLSRARKQAEEQQAAYTAAREQSATEAVRELVTAESASRAQIQQETEQKLRAAKASYQSLYDENAVREKVAQQNVAETLANLGLSDSGLNRTQQTALAATRARADAQVSLKKQQAVESLLNEMTAAIEKNRVALKEAQNAEWAAAREDEEAHRLALEKEAQTAATTQFNADLKAEEWEYDRARQEKEVEAQMHKLAVETAQQNAKIAAESQLQKQKQDADIALQQQKQSDATALQKQKQSDATALEKQKQADAMALQTKKQSDATALEKQKQANSMALQTKKQSDATALQKQKQSDATALQRQKQADSAALASQKAASSGSSKTSGALTNAQKTDLAESLRKAISERSKIYNETLRKHYDDLIAYYEAQLY